MTAGTILLLQEQVLLPDQTVGPGLDGLAC